MKVYQETLDLKTQAHKVTYLDITNQVRDVVEKSKVLNGIVVVQSPHTTCSIIFEEYMHDHDFNGDEFLHVDLNKILDNIIPRQTTENREYRYPGPKHLEFLMSLDDPNYPKDPATILNGDAHIRASFFGASETFIMKDDVIEIGSVGYIYFVDFDQIRARNRKCHVLVMGV